MICKIEFKGHGEEIEVEYIYDDLLQQCTISVGPTDAHGQIEFSNSKKAKVI
jgi:hypothetical protein